MRIEYWIRSGQGIHSTHDDTEVRRPHLAIRLRARVRADERIHPFVRACGRWWNVHGHHGRQAVRGAHEKADASR